MVTINRDEYDRVTMKVAWGKKTVQRGLLVKEHRKGVYIGVVTFHNEPTVSFVWNQKKYELPWVLGNKPGAAKSIALKKAIKAAIEKYKTAA